jgi:hypothetical protein
MKAYFDQQVKLRVKVEGLCVSLQASSIRYKLTLFLRLFCF